MNEIYTLLIYLYITHILPLLLDKYYQLFTVLFSSSLAEIINKKIAPLGAIY